MTQRSTARELIGSDGDESVGTAIGTMRSAIDIPKPNHQGHCLNVKECFAKESFAKESFGEEFNLEDQNIPFGVNRV